MGKLFKHLKPFLWAIVAIFVLLFAQAMADLSLPGYMANIVNVGIQQDGISNAVPQALSVTEFGRISFFLTADQINQVKSDYILLDKQSLSAADYAKDVKTYPQLANEDIYKINTTDKKEISSLDTIFSHTLAGRSQSGAKRRCDFCTIRNTVYGRRGPLRGAGAIAAGPTMLPCKALPRRKSMPSNRTS